MALLFYLCNPLNFVFCEILSSSHSLETVLIPIFIMLNLILILMLLIIIIVIVIMMTIIIIVIMTVVMIINMIILLLSLILPYCQHICGVHSSYQVVIVGHSLGAGIAAVLALTMRAMYPTLKCVIYGVPGSVFDWRTAQGIYYSFYICLYFCLHSVSIMSVSCFSF